MGHAVTYYIFHNEIFFFLSFILFFVFFLFCFILFAGEVTWAESGQKGWKMSAIRVHYVKPTKNQ